MKHKVSIVMPVLNGERYIGEALESIYCQTYKNFELVLVDDGSTDSTGECVKAFAGKMEIKVVRHPERQGIALSVNDGFRNASGDSLTFLDHDDVWFPDMLETLVSHLEQHPETGMVHADFQTIDPAGKVIEESVARCRNRSRPSGHVFRELFMDSFIAASSVLIRKECIDRLGGFDPTLLWGDYHLWLRIARHYRIDYIPKVVAKYRQHHTQSTRSLPAVRGGDELVAISAIKKILESYPEILQEIGEKTVRRRMACMYFGGAYYWFELGAFRNARLHLKRAIPLWPGNLTYYAMYAACLLKPSHANAMRQGWRRLRGLFSTARSGAGQWQGGRVEPSAKTGGR